MAQVVYGKVANQHRLSPFGAGLLRFLFVVALVHSFDDAVDSVRIMPDDTVVSHGSDDTVLARSYASFRPAQIAQSSSGVPRCSFS